MVSSVKTLSIVSFILFISERKASSLALAAVSLAVLLSSKFFVRTLISLLVVLSEASSSSSASCSFCFCLAMSLSSSVSFVKLFVSLLRVRCNALSEPCSSRSVSPSVFIVNQYDR